MTVSMALFTRDLRVHDNPALAAAARTDEILPVFVVDASICSSSYSSPNKAVFLAEALADLDETLRSLGGRLLLRSGDPAAEVCRLVQQFSVDEVHIAEDVSSYSRRRENRLRERLTPLGCRLLVHESSVTVCAPGSLTPAGKDHFAVFTPYHRRWSQHRLRKPLAVPKHIRLPHRADSDPLPAPSDLTAGKGSPHLPTGGESEGRAVARTWFAEGIHAYADTHDDLAADATSHLSPYLHFGCVSAVELLHHTDQSTRGGAAFARQLAWRDFHHQVLAARPASAHRDYRTHHDHWSDDHRLLAAWRAGRTGYPIVDAGMRQLAAQGWMHNRARLITAGFLTKTLYMDWRAGAQHFLEWLVDGDIANNQLNWQWVAGTGTDTRPNRVLNPHRQAERYDPDGDYVRRWVPELAHVQGRAVHRPWTLSAVAAAGYPEPIVDHDQAARAFRRIRQPEQTD
ncbi:cryptochrome/photolyase family protein [Nocardia vermiculata]|uniref:Deoxyribodipyrimidine photo-lyase n=1 Tax=Nocardia vermiculata TaxID=257274 RepID=A0A846XYY0_9NOCA|nr:deoxyribodipyrimidine photo-lyase [Nocardia vermiculata]NKY52273.1 deoxyribodipyrimidine photo-lyase [Nocardia vermiculata]